MILFYNPTGRRYLKDHCSSDALKPDICQEYFERFGFHSITNRMSEDIKKAMLVSVVGHKLYHAIVNVYDPTKVTETEIAYSDLV